MKTKFTLTFVVDLRYPGCSTPDDAIKEERRQFENDHYSWLDVFLERAEEVSLTGAVLDEPNDGDALNARLNELAIELTNLDDYNPGMIKGKGILDIYRERERIQGEYDKTYAKLIQLMSETRELIRSE